MSESNKQVHPIFQPILDAMSGHMGAEAAGGLRLTVEQRQIAAALSQVRYKDSGFEEAVERLGDLFSLADPRFDYTYFCHLSGVRK